ncbi:FAD/NAD(P)-binding domain-containing protein [Hypoxylon crocopeplum]|nr:FAD/NAD(P)-binding domain-containing protein [Hypoxylon crocopeplum]
MASNIGEANPANQLNGQHSIVPLTTEGKANDDSDLTQDEAGLSVAIIGGGIVGIILALGLVDRGVDVAVYERASDFNEIGAGIAFTGVTRECMTQLSSAVIDSLRRVANENQHAYDNYWDGYHSDKNSDENVGLNNKANVSEGTLLFQLQNAKMAWWSCLRSGFLDELSKALPQGIVSFGKELISYDSDSSGPVMLRFTDGTTATCDVVIGCDGIHSRVRQQLLSVSHPQACKPSYTGKTCFRAVVPIAAAESILGQSKAHNHCMHTGPGAHLLSYPIAQHTLLNTVLFLSGNGSPVTHRGEIVSRLSSWRPEVRELVGLMPETLLVWRIDDTADHPTPWYVKGRVCLAGDAAHASSPHHGAGAGFGVEDALALATGLGMAVGAPPSKRGEAVEAALGAYNDVRYKRTQWLVRSSRETGDIYEWMYPDSGSDPVKIKAEIAARQKKIWNFDVDGMVEEVRNRYYDRLGEGGLTA